MRTKGKKPTITLEPNIIFPDGVAEPLSVENTFQSVASSRARGGSHKDWRLGKISGELQNIDAGITPFNTSDNALDVAEAIRLCQKAYWNVSIYRLTIDIMTEFCNSVLHWRGGNKASRDFYKAWFKKIRGWSLGDQFFREWFRSSNIFLYRLDGAINLSQDNTIPSRKNIPVRYLLLNPADMRAQGAASFVNTEFYKIINNYELERLKKPVTQDDIDFKNSLPIDVQQQINNGNEPKIKLNQGNLHAIFCKKQDYEPLAVPIFFPVLFDINLKLQFKKAEQVIAKTVDYIILLITMGAKKEEGGVNQAALNAMQSLFQQESVGRVLVADYTTKMEFVIPELNKILGPEKYQVVNEDIANGMMNIFFGQEKFANSMIKIKVFLERLKEARSAFLQSFLIPEVERIGKELGFKSIPVPEFEEVDLRDDVQYWKVFNRLAEIGYLTPEETFEAFNSNQLPLPEESVENQKKFLEQKNQGLYQSIQMGKGIDATGRPGGATAPQEKKNVGPIGASTYFSIMKLQDVLGDFTKLNTSIEASYKSKLNIKRLSATHKDVCLNFAKQITSSQPSNRWEENINNCLNGSLESDKNYSDSILTICEEHNLPIFEASLLANCKREKPDSSKLNLPLD